MCGQRRGRTADLPLFRVARRPRRLTGSQRSANARVMSQIGGRLLCCLTDRREPTAGNAGPPEYPATTTDRTSGRPPVGPVTSTIRDRQVNEMAPSGVSISHTQVPRRRNDRPAAPEVPVLRGASSRRTHARLLRWSAGARAGLAEEEAPNADRLPQRPGHLTSVA